MRITRRRRTGSAGSRGARRARPPHPGRVPRCTRRAPFCVAARLASRTAVSSPAVGSIQTATRTSRSPLASISPSATASSTPWPIPSCAAPQVIVWWRSSSAVALFIISVGGQTGSYSCCVGPTQTSTGACPGAGCANMLRAAAAVGLPRRARTTLTCAPFGLSPPQPSPTRPSRSSKAGIRISAFPGRRARARVPCDPRARAGRAAPRSRARA